MDRICFSSPKGWIVEYIWHSCSHLSSKNSSSSWMLFFFLLCFVPSLLWKQDYAEFLFFFFFPKARISCVYISCTAYLRKGSHFPSPAFGNGCPRCWESDSPGAVHTGMGFCGSSGFSSCTGSLRTGSSGFFFLFPWGVCLSIRAVPVLPSAQGFL